MNSKNRYQIKKEKLVKIKPGKKFYIQSLSANGEVNRENECYCLSNEKGKLKYLIAAYGKLGKTQLSYSRMDKNGIVTTYTSRNKSQFRVVYSNSPY